MKALRVGSYAAIAITYLRNTMPQLASSSGYAPTQHTETAGTLAAPLPKVQPNLNLYLYDIELVTVAASDATKPPVILGLDLHCLMSVSDPSDTGAAQDNYLSRQLLGFWLGHFNDHPRLSFVAGPPSQAWEAPVDLVIEREPLSQAEIEGFFLAARTPLRPAVGLKIHLEEHLLVFKGKPKFPTAWSAQAKGAAPKEAVPKENTAIVITGATAAERQAALGEFAAINATTLVRANASGLRAGDTTVTLDQLREGYEKLAAAGNVLLFDDSDFLARSRPIEGAEKLVPNVGISVLATENKSLVALWRSAGAQVVELPAS